jgi:hypothetical protein
MARPSITIDRMASSPTISRPRGEVLAELHREIETLRDQRDLYLEVLFRLGRRLRKYE